MGKHKKTATHEERTPMRRRLLMRSSLVSCGLSRATPARPAMKRRN